MSSTFPAMENTSVIEPEQIDPIGITPGPAPSIYEAPDEEELRTIQHLNEKFYDAEKHRTVLDGTWEFNRQMLLGNQLVVRRIYDTEVLRVVTQDDTGRRYSQDNQLRTTARSFVGKATRIIPGVDVQPASTDRNDILGAEVRKGYLEWWGERNDTRRLYKRTWEDIPWAGTGVLQLYWDRESGEDMFWCQTCDFVSSDGFDGEECPLCAMQQALQQTPEQPQQPQQAGKMLRVKTGMARVRKLEVGEWYPEPGAIEVNQIRWCFTRRALPIAEIRRLFPVRGMLVSEESNIYKDRWLSFTGTLANSRVHTDYIKDHANLYEYHERPSMLYPEGRLVYMACDRILFDGPNPYWSRFERLPFYIFRGDRIPGTLWGESIIDQQACLQREYNHLLTQLREDREQTLAPKIFVQMNSGVKMSRMDTTSGEIIPIKKNYRFPEQLKRQGIPSWVANELQRFPQAIREKAFLTEYDVGAATGDSSGRSMALLGAQSSELMGPLMTENTPEWLLLHKHVLILAEELDPPERRWLVNGKDRFLEYTWSQVNSRSGWDITLADEDSLSKNPVLRRQEASELLQLGVYNDPSTGMPDMRRFMRDAGLKLPGAGIDSLASEHTHAAMIPERIARGEQVIPQLFDDANIHAMELMHWLRGKGRTAHPLVVQQVLLLWMQYTFAAAPTPDSQSYLPNPGMMQVAQQAGSQQGEGGASGGLPQASQNPNSMVQRADQMGESLARGPGPHEG